MYEICESISLPVSASLTPSNLSSLDVLGKLYLGVVHKGEFVIVCPQYSENAIINRVIPKLSPQQVVIQGTWIWPENPLLVLITPGAVQIFDWDGAILLHTYQMPPSSVDPDGTFFFRGVVGLPSGRICVGMHSGEILILGLKDSNNLAFIEEDRQKWFTTSVTALALWLSTMVASDEEGNIIVAKDDETLIKLATIRSSGNGITCLALLGNHTIAGYTSGHIRIFSNLEGYPIAEVFAHAKSIGGLDIARSCKMLLSVSEDTFVRVWKLDFDVKTCIEHKFCHSQTNALLCGGRFKDPSGSGFHLTAYDLPEIISFAM